VLQRKGTQNRKSLRKRYYSRKYVFSGFMLLGLILVAFIVISSMGSESTQNQESTPVTEEANQAKPEVKEFTEHKLVAIPAEGAGWVGGVLAGFAYYFTIPLWLVRVVFIAGLVLPSARDERISGALFVGYILFWIFMPEINFIPADFIARTS